MLYVGAVFAVARCPSVRLSVRPSVRPTVTLVDCIQTAEDIVKVLCRSGSPIIPVFYTQRSDPFQGNPFSGGAENTGVRKFCDCRLKSASISETVRDRPMVAMKR